MPKVSVITTLYNYRSYVEECIKSFIAQDFDDCEMIIVDDASTDNPYDVIEKYVSDKITYIRLDKNQGYSHAKNVGIINAKSDILVMLDSDDMVTKNGISSRYKKISKGYDFVHGPVMDLRSRGKMPSKLWKQWLRSKKDASCYRLVHAQSVMLRKNIHNKIGLYDENLRCKSDRELWARVFNHGLKIGWVDDYVSIYRIHSKQMHKSKEKARINDRLQREVLSLINKRATNLSDVVMLGE